MTSATRFEEVLTSLWVIAKLTENKRLSIRKGFVDIERDNKIQFLYRWWYEDDRWNSLEEAKKILREAISLAKDTIKNEIHYQSSYNGQYNMRQAVGHTADDSSLYSTVPFLQKERNLRQFGRLSEALEAASHGIETMKVTYRTDDLFCAQVDVLLGNIRDQLTEMDMALHMQDKLARGSEYTRPYQTGAPVAGHSQPQQQTGVTGHSQRQIGVCSQQPNLQTITSAPMIPTNTNVITSANESDTVIDINNTQDIEDTEDDEYDKYVSEEVIDSLF